MIGKRLLFTALSALVALCAGFATTAKAEETAKQSWTDRLTLGGQIRVRGETRGNADWFTKTRDRDSHVEERTWLTGKVKVSEQVDGFFRLQDNRNFGGETTRTAAPTAGTNTREGTTQSNVDTQSVNLREAWVKVKDVMGSGANVRVGRQIVNHGRQRYIGGFNWNGNGRSYDGINADWSLDVGDDMKNTLNAFHFRIVDDDDASGGFGGGTGARDDNRTLTGLFDVFKYGKSHEFNAFWYLNDDQRRLFLPETPTGTGTKAGQMTSSTYGLRAKGKYDFGVFFDIEGMYQLGKWASNDIRAHNYHGEVGYTVDMDMSPTVLFGYSFATGDHNSKDEDRNTPDILYPTNHLHYGMADRFSLQNLKHYELSVSLTPWEDKENNEKLDFKASAHWFGVAEINDSVYTASGAAYAAPTGRAGGHVANEYDFLVKYQFDKGVRLDVGYAILTPGAYVRHFIKSGLGSATSTGRSANPQYFAYMQLSADF